MRIKWYGHSCFLLTDEAGVSVLTDPCDESTGYHLADISADAVTSSHDHFDHNYFQAVTGDPIRITEPGEYTVGSVKITGYPTWHDNKQGALRGRNIVFLFEMDGMRIVHLGDLGHIPEQSMLDAWGKVDVLLAPIGGTYTIDHEDTRKLANLIHTRVLIPMHYKTDSLNLDILGVQPLLNAARDCSIHRLNQNECTLTKDSLGEDRLLVLDYTR